MKPQKIFFITGVNGAGKSTIIPLLKKKLPHQYRVYDFDEVGVPKNVDKAWRVETTKHWFRIAQKNAIKNIDTIVCGLTVPKEIFSVLKKNQKWETQIALLDVSKKEITTRLRRRLSTAAKVRNLKAVTGLSVTECIAANIQHAKALRSDCRKYRCQVFVTSHTTPSKTAAKVAKWIIG